MKGVNTLKVVKKNFRKYDTQRSEFKNSSQAVDKLSTAESQSVNDELQDEFKDSGSSTEIDVLSEHDGNEKSEVNLLYFELILKSLFINFKRLILYIF